MIARSYIEKNLNQLNNLYLKERTNKKKLYYSKLAVLELCGWIEEIMDGIISMCSKRFLKTQHSKDLISDVIKRNYGFDYDKHFMKMLTSVIGLVYIEKLNKIIDISKRDILKSSLGTLNKIRNSEAHTHLKGVTRSIHAPSVTLDLFKKVFDGLKNIEENLKKLKC